MKQLHTRVFFATLLLSAFYSVHSFAQATIFVKSNAAGANNGSSWANAFTHLDAALSNAQPGDNIWVASGTYRPDSTVAPNNSFLMESGVNLYGGFNGTETKLSERDPQTHVTILSGDLRGNDVVGDFTKNRTDNSLHVLRVDNGDPNNRSIIDGFLIQNGNTLNSGDATGQRGAGILAAAKVTVRNCRFTDNFGRLGVLTANGAVSSGVLVDNCIFEANNSNSTSAGVAIFAATGGEVNKCIFRNNTTNRGCLYPDNSTGIVVDSCLFEKNKSTTMGYFGSAMFTWQSSYSVTNCIFRENETYNAIVYNDGREGGKMGLWENCLFEKNKASNIGSGLYNWQANITVRNCQFIENEAPSAASFFANGNLGTSSYLIENTLFEGNKCPGYGGAAIYSVSAKFNVRRCTFRNNTGASSAGAIYNSRGKGILYGSYLEGNQSKYGGAISNYSAGADMTVDSCHFKGNKADTGGGGLTSGFTAITTIKRTLFEENTASVGAAIASQNDSTKLVVENCTFSANNAVSVGGGIGGFRSGLDVTVRGSTFIANSAATGAAIHINEDSLNLSKLVVTNTIFKENLALGQAGGVNVLNADASFTNCLFNGNLNIGSGAGGAISNNASGGKEANVTMVNCTLANNEAPIGAGIAQFQDGTSKAHLDLQNCILYNLTGDYAVESGDPTVTSKGGNLSNDQSLDTYLIGTNDLMSSDPLFVNNLGDFHLLANSPAINKGIALGAPAKDLDGKTRDSQPDMGSYEYGIIGTSEPLPIALRLTPNPATEWVQADVENEENGAATAEIIGLGGSIVRSVLTEKTSARWNLRLPIADLPAGSYFVRIRVGSTRYIGGFIKN